MEVVAVQLRARPGDRRANLERLADVVRALDGAPDLVVAPELVNSGYDLDVIGARGMELGEGRHGPTASLASELAAETGAVLVAGFLEREDDRLYDAAVIATPEGEVTTYRKSHLYPPERERFWPGDGVMTVPTAAGTLGMMICFEHAFPELATTLALRGAEILVVPAAVARGYEHLLDLRTRARAQDNQVFVVSSNLTGDGFCGRSMIVDPRGAVLASAGEEEGSIGAAVDLSAIERERAREPALSLRRPDLYGEGSSPAP